MKKHVFKTGFKVAVIIAVLAIGLVLDPTAIEHPLIKSVREKIGYNPRIGLGSFPIDPKFVLDRRIEQWGADLGINRDDLLRTKARIAPLPMGCPPGSTGCFAASYHAYGAIKDGTIYLAPEILQRDLLEQRATLAHEYLHYVWFISSESERNRLTPYLNIVYGQHKAAFDQRTASYHHRGVLPGSTDFTDELHSFIGTELHDSLLPPELLGWYTKWLPNRQALPNYLK
ncbi:MAG TPA: hypothetical protein VNA68_00640 [Candidatus Dormibacteraeota bacterium]|nr:hypothetical protein [Candidatus Dormibacteraeota bacterium]